MQRRINFLALAAGVIASLALAGPARASYITTVTLVDNTTLPVNGLDTTWTGLGGAISDVKLLTPSGVSSIIEDNTIRLTFDSPLEAGGVVTFSFVSETSPFAGLAAAASLSFDSGAWSITYAGRDGTLDVDMSTDQVVISTVPLAVPEPQSMSLIVLGLSGVLGLRRLTKQAKAARA